MKKNAFTLIELSIVLVIIGLVIGGVLVGRDLIQAAKVRATVSEGNSFQVAAATFRTKYNAVPGDLTGAQALAFGFIPTARISFSTVTNGNRLIDPESTTGSGDAPRAEMLAFWQDLSSANLIEETFTSFTSYGDGVSGPPADVSDNEHLKSYFPEAAIKGGAYWMAYSVKSAEVNEAWLPSPVALNGTYLQIFNIRNHAGGSVGYLDYNNPLTALEAYQVDSKIDDGTPHTGRVLLYDCGQSCPGASCGRCPNHYEQKPLSHFGVCATGATPEYDLDMTAITDGRYGCGVSLRFE